jgi:hypothetical protein
MSTPFRTNPMVETEVIDVGAATDTTSAPVTHQEPPCGCHGSGGGWQGPCMWVLVGALATLAVQHLWSKGFGK